MPRLTVARNHTIATAAQTNTKVIATTTGSSSPVDDSAATVELFAVVSIGVDAG